ncbi:hypothetical protein A2625_06300 [candidate division WOR-1 bacterium RIFCSPHIGHO2_01_FULL_53_15]|uniref:HEPN domain-containing protein n=1 Tax=candidate division WOR-1 bacterium RIFCSPHIGHO2_01_FULL_53_15 TaxID=1802564 RepID=A0A1F4Q1A7_UNCSA|nr:MAG: hypothetical protein A2625_06300 [candidate division WOR-1 bacterium RIFCSPHIGHO2_01_FULL_53_15]OGC13806.1 MAG: hypothetical protein A3D23_01925 [candidate division WOR-1 bacterium RIFCSPHIGHO2_02_FULL_53_26]
MSEIDIKEWLILASHDADTASLLIKQKGHADVIIYHIHQAIEKLLKALPSPRHSILGIIFLNMAAVNSVS